LLPTALLRAGGNLGGITSRRAFGFPHLEPRLDQPANRLVLRLDPLIEPIVTDGRSPPA